MAGRVEKSYFYSYKISWACLSHTGWHCSNSRCKIQSLSLDNSNSEWVTFWETNIPRKRTSYVFGLQNTIVLIWLEFFTRLPQKQYYLIQTSIHSCTLQPLIQYRVSANRKHSFQCKGTPWIWCQFIAGDIHSHTMCNLKESISLTPCLWAAGRIQRTWRKTLETWREHAESTGTNTTLEVWSDSVSTEPKCYTQAMKH